MLERIDADFADPVGRVLARSLFGDAGPARVRQALTAFCGKELGSEPAELRFFRMSVGAVLGSASRTAVLSSSSCTVGASGSAASPPCNASSDTSRTTAFRARGRSASLAAYSSCQ